ncbi:MAG: hypothetical protein IPP83_09610 [Flavobacteriales bacterium]|nr:hypothetical protein [Flavobacteriales bacterium]
MAERKGIRPSTALSKSSSKALRRAAKVARKTARMHGTAIAILREGMLVLVKP